MENSLEIWKEIINHPNYQVSNFGRIKALSKTYLSGKNNCIKNHYPEKIMKQCLNKRGAGYYQVMISERKRYYVHRLVAIHFIENPEQKPFINHKDGNGLNNHFSNLEWCTNSENVLHAVHVLGKKIGKKLS